MKRIFIYFFAVMLVVCFSAAAFTACTPNEGKYTVTYASGGGTGNVPKIEHYDEGDSFKVKGEDVFIRDGYTFSGWNDGTKVVQAGSDYTMPAKNVVFTAQWQQVAVPQLEGKWSGCEIDGEEALDLEGVVFDVIASIKEETSGIYVVMKLTGRIDDSDNDVPEATENQIDRHASENEEGSQEIALCAALWLAKDEDGNYSAEGCSVELSGSKMLITIKFGSADMQKLEFDSWEALGNAPAVDGTYSATAENGDVYTIVFGGDPKFWVKSAKDMSEFSDKESGFVGNDDMQSKVGDASEDAYKIQPYGDSLNGNEVLDSGSKKDWRVLDGTNGDGMYVEEPSNDEDDATESFDVDKIVEVGEYLVIFVNEDVYGESDSTSQKQSVAMLVLYEGENGELVANTGEGERLIFTKTENL